MERGINEGWNVWNMGDGNKGKYMNMYPVHGKYG
jgi:hypothetical protein